jgi:hypothetical protein
MLMTSPSWGGAQTYVHQLVKNERTNGEVVFAYLIAMLKK